MKAEIGVLVSEPSYIVHESYDITFVLRLSDSSGSFLLDKYSYMRNMGAKYRAIIRTRNTSSIENYFITYR